MSFDKTFDLTAGVHFFFCNIIKIKIHSSCEIEYFVETHLCKLCQCDTPIARITGCVSSLRIYIYIGRRLPLQLRCSYHFCNIYQQKTRFASHSYVRTRRWEMRKPNSWGCCGNPGICLIRAQGQKSSKGLPRATHCTYLRLPY